MAELTLNLEIYNQLIDKDRKLEEDVAKLHALLKEKEIRDIDTKCRLIHFSKR